MLVNLPYIDVKQCERLYIRQYKILLGKVCETFKLRETLEE